MELIRIASVNHQMKIIEANNCTSPALKGPKSEHGLTLCC
jgi:hypothetical protein